MQEPVRNLAVIIETNPKAFSLALKIVRTIGLSRDNNDLFSLNILASLLQCVK